MKKVYKCAWCGTEVERHESSMRGKKHAFCSRQCLADFSNKTKNPDGYKELKNYENMGKHLSELNKKLNPTRMSDETREKLRAARLNSGDGKSYAKYYGRHEHRVVAEEVLDRELRPGEVVHHRDGNKRNNTPDNIVVFKNQSDHAKHHAEMDWFVKELEKIEEVEGGDAQ